MTEEFGGYDKLVDSNDDDPRIILGFIQQAWSDIRTYTGHIWQVTGISLGLVILTINVVVTSLDTTMPNWLLPLVLSFASVFLFLGLYTFHSLRMNILHRYKVIKEMTNQLIEIKGERLVPHQDIVGRNYQPLEFIFYVFSILCPITLVAAGITAASPISQVLFPILPILAEITYWLLIIGSVFIALVFIRDQRRQRIREEKTREAILGAQIEPWMQKWIELVISKLDIKIDTTTRIVALSPKDDWTYPYPPRLFIPLSLVRNGNRFHVIFPPTRRHWSLDTKKLGEYREEIIETLNNSLKDTTHYFIIVGIGDFFEPREGLLIVGAKWTYYDLLIEPAIQGFHDKYEIPVSVETPISQIREWISTRIDPRS